MKASKVKSFTLSELLVVIIITVIVVGIAFTVLNLVRKQISGIRKNFGTTTELSLFEQQLWQDFNLHNDIVYHNKTLSLASTVDTVHYLFEEQYILRNRDTISLKVSMETLYYQGKKVTSGAVDAIFVSAPTEIPNYTIFVSMLPDAAHYINKSGF